MGLFGVNKKTNLIGSGLIGLAGLILANCFIGGHFDWHCAINILSPGIAGVGFLNTKDDNVAGVPIK